MEKNFTTYKTAIKWLHNSYIYIEADKLFKICEQFGDYDFGYLEEDEEGNTPEIFQYFLTDASDGDVEYLQENFPDLIFQYCNALGMWVLLVDHCGTAWSSVSCEVAPGGWWETNKEKYSYNALTGLKD